MNDLQKRFEDMGEMFAAGYAELPEAAPFVRFSRALRRFYETCRLAPYAGEPLYPCGSKETGLMVCPSFGTTVYVNWEALQQADAEAAQALRADLDRYESLVPEEHTVGGNMYIHSYPNFGRIAREGLDSYEGRIRKIADDDIRTGLLDLLCGIRCYHGHILRILPPDTDLYKALQKVPFGPAETVYEALVCRNFIYYLDRCDNIGAIDAELMEFYRGEDVTDLLRCFFRNADACDGWSGTLGPDYNPLTLQCLKACEGIRKPSLELRVTRDMPEEIWQAAIDAIRAGGGSPCLYNEERYQKALAELFPDMPEEDRMRWAGGGCTETMIAGCSNVGSLDAGINLALIFERFMAKKLPTAESFEDFYAGFLSECSREVCRVLDAVSASQKLRAKERPHPMRTLLVDDCIEKGMDFNAGGARYYWSDVNLAGLINVIDSLLVIDTLVFRQGRFSGAELLEQMDSGENFLRFPVPRHGMDDERANAMAKRLSADICSMFEGKTPYLGGKFLPSSIQFITYEFAGRQVGATPDGRTHGAPLCDSIGAVHGNDTKGPTALLNSAACLCQQKMAGTPVLNLKLDVNQTAVGLKTLVNGYFRQGGMQVQVTCIDQEALLDAQKHPEKYPNLIVRIGGYSEYFSRLSPKLRQTVIERTLHRI